MTNAVPSFVQEVNDPDDSASNSSANHKPFFSVPFSREAASGIAHDRFDFGNCASVFGCVLPVPVDPAELFRRHDITIYESG